MKHIEYNKKFLKRIENELKDKECTQFVIGINTGILTKKRKIRAIHEALEKEETKLSDYYNDLLKYL
jgi:DNA-binding transcriptional regulator GbsR (MarR family)